MMRAFFHCYATVFGHFDGSAQCVTGENKHFLFNSLADDAKPDGCPTERIVCRWRQTGRPTVPGRSSVFQGKKAFAPTLMVQSSWRNCFLPAFAGANE